MWSDHLFISVCKLSGLSCVQTPPSFPHVPLPHLIKLIQSGACVRAGPHYLRLSGPGCSLTPQVCHRVLPAPPTGGAADPTPSTVPHPPGEQRTNSWWGASWETSACSSPPPPSLYTYTETHRNHLLTGEYVLLLLNLERLYVGS